MPDGKHETAAEDGELRRLATEALDPYARNREHNLRAFPEVHIVEMMPRERAFMAAITPAVVLALLDRLEAQRG